VLVFDQERPYWRRRREVMFRVDRDGEEGEEGGEGGEGEGYAECAECAEDL